MINKDIINNFMGREQLTDEELDSVIVEVFRELNLDKVLNEMATVRFGRLFYGVALQRLSKTRASAIASKLGVEPASLQNRLFARGDIAGSEITLTYYYAEKGITPNDVKEANKRQGLTSNMEGAVEAYRETRPVEVGQTKLGWLTSKGEELTAELEELNSAKDLFKQAGIGPDQPARITIIGTDGGQEVVNGVVGIDKITDKAAIGDFKLIDASGNTLYSISHKALGFERYAALVSALKKRNPDEVESARDFLRDCALRWKQDFLGNKTRSPKGFIRAVPEANAQDALDLIYGPLAENSANALFIGNLKLDKAEEGFSLSILPVQHARLGSSAAYVKTLPDTEDYSPVYRSRYGSGGSYIALDPEEIEFLNHQILAGQRTIGQIKEWVGGNFKTTQIPREAALEICAEAKCGVSAVIVENIKIPVRYYISPLRRADGGESI